MRSRKLVEFPSVLVLATDNDVKAQVADFNSNVNPKFKVSLTLSLGPVIYSVS